MKETGQRIVFQDNQTPGRHLYAELVDEVMRTHGRMVAVSRALNNPKLKGSHGMILSAVVMAPEPPTVSRIARSLGYSRQAIQRLVDSLAATGYIRFEDNPFHLRAKLLIATEAGRRAHAEGDRKSRSWAAHITKDISAKNLRLVVETLRHIRGKLEDEVRPLKSLPAKPTLKRPPATARRARQHMDG